jgi:SAM-dependent methyltransferase
MQAESLAAYPIGENTAQTQRLITQAQLYDPFTRAFFQMAGIARGMKVLDLGSGVGDVSLLAAELVGPDGRVVGVELNANAAATARARVAAVGWRNVEIVEGQIESAALDQDFDAVVGRFVLMWLPDPRVALRRVVGLVRAGGIVAFQDNDFTFNVSVSASLPVMEKWGAAFGATQGAGGPDFHMGLKMPRLFQEVGLRPPRMTFDAPLGTGPEWSGYRMIAETVGMLLPRMQQLGVVPPVEVDIAKLAEQIRDEAVEHQAVIVLPAIIGAASRKV